MTDFSFTNTTHHPKKMVIIRITCLKKRNHIICELQLLSEIITLATVFVLRSKVYYVLMRSREARD